MKKIVLPLFLTASAIMAIAQDPATSGVVLDAAEDTTHVVTIADIVNQQERVTSQHSTSSHFSKVWGYKSYFNLSYMNDATLKPDGAITLGYDEINNNKVPDFKADYGVALQLGHSYNLHKQPIANLLYINLDYTYIDLSLAHYKKEPGKYVYNSDNTWDEQSKNSGASNKVQYIPWCLEKYDINYGMHLGPSLTIAPFTYLPCENLHFFKFNFYYHIGYQAGVLWMINDKEADAAQKTSSYNESDPMKLNWQHGLVNSFGVSLSWKTIGVGFESRSDSRTYKSFDTSTYGSKEYKFKGANSRIYLKICY